MRMTRTEKLFVNSPRHSRRVARQLTSRLESIRPTPGQRLLDVGCGNGAAAIEAARALGLDVTGVDVDPAQVAAAREAARGLHVVFERADVTALPFRDASFAIVATNKVTHHVPDWPRGLAEMVRVLAPGGMLLYGDFVLPDWLGRLLQSFVGRRAGVVTRTALKREADWLGLREAQATRRGLVYEAAFVKP